MKEWEVSAVVDVTISGAKHCGNSCRFLRDTEVEIRGKSGILLYEAKPTRCMFGLYPVVLVWDKKRKAFGYLRTEECLRMTLPQ